MSNQTLPSFELRGTLPTAFLSQDWATNSSTPALASNSRKTFLFFFATFICHSEPKKSNSRRTTTSHTSLTINHSQKTKNQRADDYDWMAKLIEERYPRFDVQLSTGGSSLRETYLSIPSYRSKSEVNLMALYFQKPTYYFNPSEQISLGSRTRIQSGEWRLISGLEMWNITCPLRDKPDHQWSRGEVRNWRWR